MINADVVRELIAAYRNADRDKAETLVGAELVFTSPQDDHIDRDAYFERCFPTADRFSRMNLLAVVPSGTDDVFILYEYELTSGEVYRNTEVVTVRDRQVREIQVFFGGRFG